MQYHSHIQSQAYTEIVLATRVFSSVLQNVRLLADHCPNGIRDSEKWSAMIKDTQQASEEEFRKCNFSWYKELSPLCSGYVHP